MKDKKNIDNLFNESFKNFEASPSPRVWENIQAELRKEKNNRKPIPLWIKYGGIAALLALLLTVGNWVFNSSEPIQKSISNENNVTPVEEIQQTENSLETKTPEAQVAVENKNTHPESTRVTRESVHKIHKNPNGQGSDYKSKQTEIASKNSENSTSKLNESRNKLSRQKNTQKTNANQGIATSKTTSKLSSESESSMNQTGNREQVNKSGRIISENNDDRISVSQTEKTEETPLKPEISEDPKNKKSILDAIAEKEEVETEILKEQKSKPDHRWNISPNVAPVYYSSLGKGSSIDPDFSNNPQKGDVNMSYGLQISYALSERLSVRAGVNNVDLSYSTSDILIGTGPVGIALRSVDYGSKQIVVTALTRESFNAGTHSNDFGEINLKSSGADARLIQNINYYEIPLELKYAVINNKLGVNLIGGVSTLFLGNNEISVKSDNFSSVLGEANNLSNVSFSTNVGLGLDYRISKRFIFNLEPMFKYQLNPYTDSSVSFRPYYLGVYSGFSFKF